jgi:Na+-transporting NADH:ubiquinone oxidoreductase subunit C
MKKSFAYPIILMSLLTAVFTLVLSYLNYSTAEKISLLQGADLQRKILYVFDIDTPSDEPDDIRKVFEEKIESEEIKDEIIYTFKENGEVKGYAFPATGPGLWGTINAYVGISKDYSEVLGLEFISQDETPGLGGRIAEEWYKEQFRGIDLTNVSDNNYVIYRPATGGNVDAIAGATLTSKSVSKLVNEDMYNFIKDRKGGQ